MRNVIQIITLPYYFFIFLLAKAELSLKMLCDRFLPLMLELLLEMIDIAFPNCDVILFLAFSLGVSLKMLNVLLDTIVTIIQWLQSS